MSKKSRDLVKDLLADLESITPDVPDPARYQLGYIAAHLARIYEHDWILRQEWTDRIEQLKRT